MVSRIDKDLLNVVLLGFGFFFLFTAFQTLGNIQKVVLDSIAAEDPSFVADGYVCLAIIYTMFGLCNCLAPSVLSVIGPRVGMLISSLIYLAYIVSFRFPQTWLLYTASGLLGIGAALLWTGQGQYLTQCGDATTVSRNAGIFWAMLQANLFVGNTFVYFQFRGKIHIDEATRNQIIYVLIGIAIVGIIFFISLRQPARMRLANGRRKAATTSATTQIAEDDEDANADEPVGVMQTFKDAGRLLFTREMLTLSLTFLYSGFVLAFYSSVYPSSLGFTLAFGERAKEMIALAGICIGVGAVGGGILFGSLSANRFFTRDRIVVAGMCMHLAAFVLIGVNQPDDSLSGETMALGVLSAPSVWLALVAAGLLGFGDSCFTTQIYAMLGTVFAKQSASAFAIFKLVQSASTAAVFVLSSHVGLTVALSLLGAFGVVGTGGFCAIEWAVRRSKRTAVGEASADEISKRLNADVNGSWEDRQVVL